MAKISGKIIIILLSLILPEVLLQGSTNNFKGTGNISSSCGRRQLSGGRQGRILNGSYTYFGEFPWMVFFVYLGNQDCAGALIADNWVLTTAQCVKDTDYVNFDVLLGVHTYKATTKQDKSVLRRKLNRYIIHPLYNSTIEVGYDIALVQLDSPVEFKPHIQPICLPKFSENNLIGKMATVSGWGRMESGSAHYPSILRKATIPIMKIEVCERMRALINRFRNISDSLLICAGYRSGKVGPCKGDSGAPLQLEREDGSWYVAGLVSWAYRGCIGLNNPMFFTKINAHVPWIRKTIFKHSNKIV